MVQFFSGTFSLRNDRNQWKLAIKYLSIWNRCAVSIKTNMYEMYDTIPDVMYNRGSVPVYEGVLICLSLILEY